MMLSTILSIAGKSGLYRLVSQANKQTLIVESLVDGRRQPVHARDRVVSLADIAMFTYGADVPLSEVLTKLSNYSGGKPVDMAELVTKEALSEYFAQVLPDYDRERVYATDIKKLLVWYNLLLSAGVTDFAASSSAEEV